MIRCFERSEARCFSYELRNIHDCIVIIATTPRGPERLEQRSMKPENRSDLPAGYSSFMNCVVVSRLLGPGGIVRCTAGAGAFRRPATNGYPDGYLLVRPRLSGLGMPASKQRSKGSGSVYQNSRGQWVAAIEAGWGAKGTRRRLTLKARTEADVRARLAELQLRVADEGPTGASRTATMKRWADEWLTERERVVRPGTFVSDRSAILRWIVPTIGHLRLDSLTPSNIRQVASSQEGVGLALATMQRTHAVLRKLLSNAVADGYRVSQRARETASPGLGPSPRQSLSVADASRILAVAATRPDASRWVAALVEGLRPAEALGLTWDMIDLNNETMTLAWQLKALPYVEHRSPDRGFRVPRGFEYRQLQGAYHLVRPKTRAGRRRHPTGWSGPVRMARHDRPSSTGVSGA